jgi:DNA repair protein RadD
MELRKFQKEAVSKMLWAMSLPGNDVISLPTGSGKTYVIAGFVEKLKEPILILTPNKELSEQDLEKLKMVVNEKEIGVFSASMDEKTVKKFTLGTIQSVYKHPRLFERFDVVIVDESDLVPVDDKKSMYMKLFKGAKVKKVFGLSATPFRQDTYYEYPGGWKNYQGKSWQKMQIESVTTTKMINRYKGGFWRRMLAVVNTDDLLEQGYLSPIKYIDKSVITHDKLKLNKSESDFDIQDFDKRTQHGYPIITQFIEKLPHDSIIVYCSSIEQAEALNKLTKGSAVVTSNTSKKEREKAVLALKNGSLHILYNVSVFTVGFDYPQLEAIVFLRPTRSLRLYSQMVGRVTRVVEGKEYGYVYDLVGNVKSMGKIEDIKIKKLKTGWDIVSPVHPDGWHNKPLYKISMKELRAIAKKRREDENFHNFENN